MTEYRRLSMKEWAAEDRPREKMMLQGARALSDAELIAILIGSGNAEETAVELSRRILNSTGNSLNELGRKNAEYLTGFKGIGDAKAINILAAMELGRRRKDTHMDGKVRITSSTLVADLMTPLLADLNHEEFWVLLLNRSNEVIHQYMVSKGGISSTVIDVRMILKTALERYATSMILCHNHPSGNLTPSDADLQITRKIKDAGRIMEVQVLDHLIITQKNYYSFADNGIL